MKGWEVKALGEVADCCLGKMLDKAKNRGTPRPYLRNINVRWFEFDLSDLLEMPFENDEFDRYSAIAGDVLICEGGYPGRAAIWEDDAPIFFQKAIHRVRFSDRNRAKWLVYYLWFLDASGELKSHFTGSGIQHFTGQALKKLRIPLPPLDEQRRIVAILDEAFAGLAVMRQHAEANLKNARALFDSHLNAIFSQRGEGWVTEGLNEHVRFVDYRGKTPPKRDAGIRLITAKNVKMGFIRREPEEFIDPAAYDEWMTRGFPNKGDVLFTTEAPLGNVAQLDTDEKVVIGQRLITMQPVPSVLDRKFLAFMLMSGPLQDAIHAKATGATVLGIKAKLLKFIPISYPQKLAEQRAIADSIEEIALEVARLESLYRQKLTAVDELKQSILHRAFSGALSAKDALAA